MIKLSKHFTLRELTRSALATRLKVKNEPGELAIANLTCLCQNILEPVRIHFKIPFSPSSGFRGIALNTLVNSKPSSQHVTGQAADFEIPGIANRDLADWIKANLIFDQLILEFHHPDIPDSGWIHCSYVQGDNRKQALIFDGSNYRNF